MIIRTHNQNTLKMGSSNGECDVCSFKFKREDLRQRWDGAIVCPKHWEAKHPSLTYNYKARDEGSGGKAYGRIGDGNDSDPGGGTDISGGTFPPALTLAAATFADQNTQDAFSHQYAFTGAASVTWEVTVGALPSGLTLDANTGLMSGTLTTAESASWTIKITAPDGRTDTEAFTMTVANGLYDLITDNSALAYFFKFDDNGDWDNDIAVNYATNVVDVEDSILDPVGAIAGDAQVDRYITKGTGVGSVGDAGVFNGTSSYLYCPQYSWVTNMPGTPTTNYWLTNEFVIKMDALPGAGERYFLASMGPYGTSGSNRGWIIWITETGEYRCVIYGSQQNDFWASTTAVPVGEWVHIVSSVAVQPNGKPTERRIFFNGVDAGWQTYSANQYASVYGDSPMELRLGCRRVYNGTVNGGNPDGYFAGKMAMAAGYYRYEMSEATILEHYAATGI